MVISNSEKFAQFFFNFSSDVRYLYWDIIKLKFIAESPTLKGKSSLTKELHTQCSNSKPLINDEEILTISL